MNSIGKPTIPWLSESFLIEQTPAAWEWFCVLQNDPDKVKNLYGDPEDQEVIAELKKRLKQTRERLNGTGEEYPHIQKVIGQH